MTRRRAARWRRFLARWLRRYRLVHTYTSADIVMARNEFPLQHTAGLRREWNALYAELGRVCAVPIGGPSVEMEW